MISEDGLDDSTDLKLRPRLIVENDGKESIYSLEEEMVIGRAGTLAIPDARVSRRHARIIRKDKQYVVEDMGSSNGTFVNDQKISGQVVLKSNDRDPRRLLQDALLHPGGGATGGRRRARSPQSRWWASWSSPSAERRWSTPSPSATTSATAPRLGPVALTGSSGRDHPQG